MASSFWIALIKHDCTQITPNMIKTKNSCSPLSASVLSSRQIQEPIKQWSIEYFYSFLSKCINLQENFVYKVWYICFPFRDLNHFPWHAVKYTENNFFLLLHWTKLNTAQLLVSMCQTYNTVLFCTFQVNNIMMSSKRRLANQDS
jgi:hypothetical protein